MKRQQFDALVPMLYGLSELTGAERDAAYTEQSAEFPGFADYQEKTSRVIPVVALTRV